MGVAEPDGVLEIEAPFLPEMCLGNGIILLDDEVLASDLDFLLMSEGARDIPSSMIGFNAFSAVGVCVAAMGSGATKAFPTVMIPSPLFFFSFAAALELDLFNFDLSHLRKARVQD